MNNQLIQRLQELLIEVQSGDLGETSLEDPEVCGKIHEILENSI